MKQQNSVPTTQDVLTHHLNSFGAIAGITFGARLCLCLMA